MYSCSSSRFNRGRFRAEIGAQALQMGRVRPLRYLPTSRNQHGSRWVAIGFQHPAAAPQRRSASTSPADDSRLASSIKFLGLDYGKTLTLNGTRDVIAEMAIRNSAPGEREERERVWAEHGRWYSENWNKAVTNALPSVELDSWCELSFGEFADNLAPFELEANKRLEESRILAGITPMCIAKTSGTAVFARPGAKDVISQICCNAVSDQLPIPA
jgi:hypothetical protein